MAFKKSKNLATAHHPQICILVIDDSGSMAEEGKCKQVTDAVQDMVITMQSLNMGTHGYRFLLNICKFGDAPTELAVAKSPPEVDVDMLEFDGGSGGTEMLPALEWAEEALKKSLERCRSIPNYQEEQAPNPICVFLSDGECTGEDPSAAAKEVMKGIASRPEYAIRIDSEGVADFLGDVGGTVVEGTDVAHLAAKAKAR
jgi:hypothetical protein